MSGIKSSIRISFAEYSIIDLLSSPYLSLITAISSLMICILTGSLSKISFKFVINFIISSYSPLNLSCSRPVNCLNRISTIALDWISDKLKRVIKFSLASSAFFDALMILITSSMLSDAIISPSKICALSSAFLNSYFVLLTTTSCLCSTKW